MGINLLYKGYNDVQATVQGEFTPLPPGGYVCRVCHAFISQSKSGKDMLTLFVDIAEGDFAFHFQRAADRVKNFDSSKQWDNAGIYRQLILHNDGRVSPFFKGLLTCFDKSNPNLNLNLANFEPQILRGALIGFIFAQEEYTKNNGKLGTRTFIKFPLVVNDIREGNFNVPALKKIAEQGNDFMKDSTPVDNEDIPF